MMHPDSILTRDAFGDTLFDVIVRCGAILQLRQYREQTPPPRIKAGQLEEWQRREQVLIAELARLMPTLPSGDVADLLQHYRWVAQC